MLALKPVNLRKRQLNRTESIIPPNRTYRAKEKLLERLQSQRVIVIYYTIHKGKHCCSIKRRFNPK